mmetsp:Transcript_22170/g.27835  ORF Transcript_22170/g.27835 Transcript_22170/m.27835 type:complete len:948 (-) Transcript_22170:148-2991(-)
MSSFQLIETGKFSVLEASSNSENDMGGAAGAKEVALPSVCTGNRKMPLEDFVAVAVKGAEVDLDKGTVEKMQKAEGVSEEAYEFSDDELNASFSQKLSASEARGALFARIVAYLQGRSGVSPAVVTTLSEVLNSGEPVALPAAEDMEGLAVCLLLNDQGVQLTVAEVRTISGRPYSPVSKAGLSAYAALSMVPVADAAAALSCEFFKAFTEPFESVHFDICRQHRGQMIVAENLRLLLEGSKCVNSRPATDVEDAEAIRCIPQLHGPARDAALAAAKAVEIEVNSAEAGPLGTAASEASPYHTQQLHTALLQSQDSVATFLEASTARLELLGITAAGGRNGLIKLQNALATEIKHVITWMEKEEKKSGGGAVAGKKGPPTEDARAAAARAKEDEKLKNMTPEQRAKVEAKRKAKEEKAAAKAAKKAAKKGTEGGGLAVGVGSAALKTQLLVLCGGNASQTALTAALDPYAVGDASFGRFSTTLIEKLGSGGVRRKPKIAKGTRDFLPEQMRIRERAFQIIRNVFKLHGAVEIETPVFELKETLTGKYGEDSKLIYDLADQGGELLSLRYDLTVPFARYLALHSVGNIKRYHIARVYRRDQPNIQAGRFREFYQCDFDIAGRYSPMVPDAEVLSVASEILSQLPIGDFEIKINHRKLLDSIFDVCGVPEEKFRMICSSVDKLDKMPWEEVKKEMTLVKGLQEDVADRIGEFVILRGEPFELLEKLKGDDIQQKFKGNKMAADALEDMELLFTYLDSMGSLGNLKFDLSLARGLDYYTGVIYECLVTSGETKLGSIGGGGRYDNLVGMFSVGGQQIPCVGVSIGIDRLFTLVEQNAKETGLYAASNVQVLVASAGNGMLPHRMKLAKDLWESGIPAEFSHQPNAKLKKQLEDALQRNIPYMVIIGEDEIKNNIVKVKDLGAHFEETVPRDQAANLLFERGCKRVVTSQI